MKSRQAGHLIIAHWLQPEFVCQQQGEVEASHIETNASDVCGVHFEGSQQSLALAGKLCRGVCKARQCYAAAHVVTVPMPHEFGGVGGVGLATLQLQADRAPFDTSSCTQTVTVCKSTITV